MPDSQPRLGLGGLPQEVLNNITQHLDCTAISRVSTTCKSLNQNMTDALYSRITLKWIGRFYGQYSQISYPRIDTLISLLAGRPHLVPKVRRLQLRAENFWLTHMDNLSQPGIQPIPRSAYLNSHTIDAYMVQHGYSLQWRLSVAIHTDQKALLALLLSMLTGLEELVINAEMGWANEYFEEAANHMLDGNPYPKLKTVSIAGLLTGGRRTNIRNDESANGLLAQILRLSSLNTLTIQQGSAYPMPLLLRHARTGRAYASITTLNLSQSTVSPPRLFYYRSTINLPALKRFNYEYSPPEFNRFFSSIYRDCLQSALAQVGTRLTHLKIVLFSAIPSDDYEIPCTRSLEAIINFQRYPLKTLYVSFSVVIPWFTTLTPDLQAALPNYAQEFWNKVPASIEKIVLVYDLNRELEYSGLNDTDTWVAFFDAALSKCNWKDSFPNLRRLDFDFQKMRWPSWTVGIPWGQLRDLCRTYGLECEVIDAEVEWENEEVQ